MNKKENMAIRYVKGVCCGLLAWVMCVIFSFSTGLITQHHVFLKLLAGFCTSVITLGLFFNWTHYACKRDKDRIKFRGMEYDRKIPIKMAIFAPLPSYVMLILLYLMKAGVMNDSFEFYIFFNIWVKPFIDMFTDLSAEQRIGITEVPLIGLLGITLLILLQPAVIILTYLLTYNNIDAYKAIFFKKDT